MLKTIITKSRPDKYVISPAGLNREQLNNEVRYCTQCVIKSKRRTLFKWHIVQWTMFITYLYGILLWFRPGKFELVADIRQAFLQIGITEDHRDLLRFLWFKNINDVPLTPTTFRFTIVVYGLTSSPFLLNGTIKHHLEKYMLNPNFMEIIKKLIMNLQVDDSTNIFDNLQISSIIYKYLR